MGPCNYCGFCSDYSCLNYSKASPNACILPALRRAKDLSTCAPARRCCEVNSGQRRQDEGDRRHLPGRGRPGVPSSPPTSCRCARSRSSMCTSCCCSGIGKPYDPVTGEGVTGPQLFLPEPQPAQPVLRRVGAGQPVHRHRRRRGDLRRPQRQAARPHAVGLHRRRHHLGAPARHRPDTRHSRAGRHAELGQRVEEGRQDVVPPFVLLRSPGRVHVLSQQLPRAWTPPTRTRSAGPCCA